MELRYLGFSQSQGRRVYRFDCLSKGDNARQFVVSADLALFLKHHVGIQEGPALSAQKLAADLDGCREGRHELTDSDLYAWAAARDALEARKAESRKSSFRRRTFTRAAR